MGVFSQLVGYHANDPSIPFLPRDAIIDARTAGLVDLGSRWAIDPTPRTLVLDELFKDLVRGGLDANVRTGIPFTGNALQLQGASQLVRLGANWKVPSVPHFAVGFWIDLTKTGYDTTVMVLGGYKDQAANQYQWHFAAQASAGTMTNLLFIANGKSLLATAPAAGLHQIVGEYEVVGTDHLVRIYIDTVLVATSTVSAQSYVLPVAGNNPGIGLYTPSYAETFIADVHRAWLQRLDTAGKSLAEIMALDYQRNLSRFAA